MRGICLLAWTVCATLVLVSIAWAQAPGRTAEQDDVFWESVSGCTSAVEVEMYISEFGEEGRHVAEARACLEKLGKAVPASGRKTAPPTEIERLLRVCEAHFAANRLTTGVGGTAIECYREVQSLDPANMVAVEGLQRVFGKYAAWARAALERGDVGDAQGYVGKLKKLNPESPQAKVLEREIARLEKEAAEAREKAEAERKEREKVEQERRDRVKRTQAEADRKERERAEAEGKEREEREKRAQAEAARMEWEKAGRSAQPKNFISIGTGGPTGVYFVVGNSVCRMVHKEAAEGRRLGRKHGIRCSAPSTGGSTYNIGQISQGNLDFGVAQSDWQYHSYNCSSHKVICFKKLRAVFSIHAEPLHVIVGENSGIKSWNDLKGKRVNIGLPGSGDRGMMEGLMKAHGTNMGDFARVTELFSFEGGRALCDGKIDAYGYVGGIPGARVAEAIARCDAKVIDLNSTAARKLVDDNPFYAFATVPKGTYKATDSDVITFGVMATFVTSTDVPKEVVYEVTRAVFENLDDFKNLHPSFANLDPKKMVKDALSAPLHAGAIKYYREKGLM